MPPSFQCLELLRDETLTIAVGPLTELLLDFLPFPACRYVVLLLRLDAYFAPEPPPGLPSFKCPIYRWRCNFIFRFFCSRLIRFFRGLHPLFPIPYPQHLQFCIRFLPTLTILRLFSILVLPIFISPNRHVSVPVRVIPMRPIRHPPPPTSTCPSSFF